MHTHMNIFMYSLKYIQILDILLKGGLMTACRDFLMNCWRFLHQTWFREWGDERQWDANTRCHQGRNPLPEECRRSLDQGIVDCSGQNHTHNTTAGFGVSVKVWLNSRAGQMNRWGSVPVPMTGVCYDSLLWMCTLNTLTCSDLWLNIVYRITNVIVVWVSFLVVCLLLFFITNKTYDCGYNMIITVFDIPVVE